MLLANPGFVLPPKFDRLFARMLGDCGGDQIGKVLLCASCAAGSCCGWRGRTDKRRNPSRRNIAPTLRSANVTLKRVHAGQIQPAPAHHAIQGLVLCEPALLPPPRRGLGPGVMRFESPATPSAW